MFYVFVFNFFIIHIQLYTLSALICSQFSPYVVSCPTQRVHVYRLPLSNCINHTCQVLRFGRSHYGFLDKLKTTGVVGKDYGFMLFWRCNFFGNHLITFGLLLD